MDTVVLPASHPAEFRTRPGTPERLRASEYRTDPVRRRRPRVGTRSPRPPRPLHQRGCIGCVGAARRSNRRRTAAAETCR